MDGAAVAEIATMTEGINGRGLEKLVISMQGRAYGTAGEGEEPRLTKSSQVVLTLMYYLSLCGEDEGSKCAPGFTKVPPYVSKKKKVTPPSPSEKLLCKACTTVSDRG